MFKKEEEEEAKLVIPFIHWNVWILDLEWVDSWLLFSETSISFRFFENQAEKETKRYLHSLLLCLDIPTEKLKEENELSLSLSYLLLVARLGWLTPWPIVQADDSNFSFDKLLSLTSRKRSDGQQQLSCVIPFLRDSWRRVRTLTNHPFKWRPNWAEGGERKTEN